MNPTSAASVVLDPLIPWEALAVMGAIGLALVLMFIGAKMVADPWLHISVLLSLSLVGGILFVAMLISVLTRPPKKKEPGSG